MKINKTTPEFESRGLLERNRNLSMAMSSQDRAAKRTGISYVFDVTRSAESIIR